MSKPFHDHNVAVIVELYVSVLKVNKRLRFLMINIDSLYGSKHNFHESIHLYCKMNSLDN